MAFHLIETPLNDTQSVKELEKINYVKASPDTLQFEQWLMSFGSNIEIQTQKIKKNLGQK